MVTTRSKTKKDKNKKSKASKTKSSEVPKSEVRDVEKVLRMQNYTGPSRKINVGLIVLALAALIGGIVGIVMIIRGASDDTKKDPTSAPGTQAPGTQAPGTQAPGDTGTGGDTGGGGSTETKDEKSWAQKYWWVIALIVLAVLGAIFGGGWALYFRNKNEATQVATGEEQGPTVEPVESSFSRFKSKAAGLTESGISGLRGLKRYNPVKSKASVDFMSRDRASSGASIAKNDEE